MLSLLDWDTQLWQAYALLYDSVNKEDLTVRIGAIMGLGLAYAGSQKEEVSYQPACLVSLNTFWL